VEGILVLDQGFVLLVDILEGGEDSHHSPLGGEGSHHNPLVGEAVPVLCSLDVLDIPILGRGELLGQGGLLALLGRALLLLRNSQEIVDSYLAEASLRWVLDPLRMRRLHRGRLEGGQVVDSQGPVDLLEGTVVHILGSKGFLDTVLGVLLAPCILVHR